MNPDRRASGRYRLLLEWLRDEFTAEHGKERGWKRWAGTKLGIDETYINPLLDRTRQAGGDVVQRAVDLMRIDSDFFYGDFEEEPSPKDFIGVVRLAAEGGAFSVSGAHAELTVSRAEEPRVVTDDSVAFQDFLAGGEMAPVTREEIAYLREWATTKAYKGGLQPSHFVVALDIRRREQSGRLPLPEREQVDDVNEEARAEAERRGYKTLEPRKPKKR